MTEVRMAREEDLSRLSQIGAQSGLDVTEASIRASFHDPARCLVLACSGAHAGGILGYADLLLSGSDAEIVDIAVSEEARSGGVGEALIRSVQRQITGDAGPESCVTIYLEVAEDNLPARRLYEKTGFEAVGRRKNYYPGHQDAIVMRWTGDTGRIPDGR